MKRWWQIGNIISIVFAIVANVLIGAKLVGLPGINEVSDKYSTLLTPANYAFSIWSVIYVLLVVFAIYQARDIGHPLKANKLPEKLGPFFIIANICNGIWTYLFVKEYILASMLAIGALTISLFIALYKLRIAVYDALRSEIICVWWPLLIYTGWVVVASVVNFASLFNSYGVQIPAFVLIAILMILCFSLAAILIKRNVRELVLASAWGILAIGFHDSKTAGSGIVRSSAVVLATLLLVAVIVHGYINRKSNPFLRY